MKPIQFTSLVILCCLGHWCVAQEAAIDFSQPGFSKVAPEKGPSVPIEGGFMVPYTVTVPGSEVTFEMIPIPGGEFMMGSPENEKDRRKDEGPQAKIAVAPFWMGKHEVTWAEYNIYWNLKKPFRDFKRKELRLVTDQTKVDAVTIPSKLYDAETTYDAGDADDEPAASMTQFAAKQYTKFLSLLVDDFYRLPTEAEWEYACRAGTKTRFYFGDDPKEIDKHAWHYDNADEYRNSVGQKLPNPFGLYDMYGNVSEWVLDQYSEEAYQRLQGKTSTTDEAYLKPTTLYPRVCRGGSYQLEIEDCRSAARQPSTIKWKEGDPQDPHSPWWLASTELDSPCFGIGFRLLRPLDVPKSREAKETFWSADIEEINEDAEDRVLIGRGTIGLVDENLLEAIQGLDK